LKPEISSDGGTEATRIPRAWKRLAKMFGYSFTRQFGVADDGTWARGLRGYSEQEIARGLEACLRWHRDFPPNLSQFKQLCRPVETRPFASMYVIPLVPPERHLTQKSTDEQKLRCSELIAACKSKLGAASKC